MNETHQPASTDSKFGWTSDARKVMLEKLLSNDSKATSRIRFQGQIIDLPIIRLPIGLPKYRLENGRTVSKQAEFLARHPKLPKNYFTLDPEMLDAQEEQHRLLLELSERTELHKKFVDPINKQVEPLILDSRGFVVNGNRRLSFWRNLYYDNMTKYDHFSHIDAIVLPPCTPEDIDRLEARLQIEKDIREDYSWDAEANMMLEKMKRDGFSEKDLAILYDMEEEEIEHLLKMRDYGAEYLRSRGKEDLWSSISGAKYAFGTLANTAKKIVGVEDKSLFKEAAFTLIDNPTEVGDSVHDAIKSMKDFFPQIKEKLFDNFEVAGSSPEKAAVELLGELPSSSAGNDRNGKTIPLANAIQKPENTALARSVIVDAIISEKQKKRDAKSASYLRKCCSDANANLTNAVKDGLKPESNTTGVEAQLQQIESHLAVIRKFLVENAHD